MRVGQEDRLIKKRKGAEEEFKFVLAFEEIHSAIAVAHAAVGHGGDKKTRAELTKKYANVTMEACKIFIDFCVPCQEKKKRNVQKGFVIKPV